MKKATLSGSLPKRNLIVEIFASLLLIFFVHSVISNAINLQSLKNLLPFYTRHNNVGAWMILISEALIVILLFFPRTRFAGFVVVLLASLFAGYIVLKYPDYPHHFGGLLSKLSDKQQIIFYSLLSTSSIFSGFLIIHKRKDRNIPAQDPVVFT